MNIIFLWFGLSDPLYLWRDECIRRAITLYPDAHFQCVTTLNSFYGMEIIDARQVVEEMRVGGYFADIKNFICLSDEMRFYWLERHENTLYLDTDTYCKKRMEPRPEAGKAGIEALWSGNDLAPFSEIMRIRIKGQFFVDLAHKLRAEDLTEYFEHKPLWAKKIRNNHRKP